VSATFLRIRLVSNAFCLGTFYPDILRIKPCTVHAPISRLAAGSWTRTVAAAAVAQTVRYLRIQTYLQHVVLIRARFNRAVNRVQRAQCNQLAFTLRCTAIHCCLVAVRRRH